MLSFKISQGAHDKVRRVSSIICTLFSIGFVVVMCLTAIGDHLRAKRILADHSVVSAPLVLDEVTEERGRRGRTKEMYHFTYQFEVKGQPYIGRFDVAGSNADKYPEVPCCRSPTPTPPRRTSTAWTASRSSPTPAACSPAWAWACWGPR